MQASRRRFGLLSAAVAAASLCLTVLAPAHAADQTVRIGVTGGPHAQIMEEVKKVAARDHLNIKIVEFNDYIQPNAALAAGDLDANSYQHQPYLDGQVKDRGYKLVSIGTTITFPMGIYSKKHKSLDQLPKGARLGVPNDPTNGGRGLLLMASKGLFKLRPNAGLSATPLDIVDNPRKFKVLEIDAAQLPRSLDDLDAAAINGNYAGSAGLDPVRDAISMEGPDGPYANVIVIRAEDKNKPWVAQLLKAYHSPEVKEFISKTFKASVIPSW